MKKLLFCALAGAIGFAGAKAYEHSQKSSTEDLLLRNVEALSNSPEEGVKIGTCYFSAWPDTTDEESVWVLECERGTTMNKIFPCGSEHSIIRQSSGSCIKK